jgi:Domain of unknown function (DUF4831)
MKTTIRLSVSVISLFFILSCSSGRKLAEQKSIMPFFDTLGAREGSIVYGLPRTVLTVEIEMERTIEIPGPYAQFAGDLLGLNNVINNKRESWKIEGLTVKTNSEPDPSELYVISSNTGFQTNALVLKKEGLILDLNPELFNFQMDQYSKRENTISQFNSFDLGSDEYYQTQSDTAYKRVSVDSTFIRIPYVVEKKKRLTKDQLAEKAARRLMEMRDGKHLILTGEATVFPQNEAPLIEMNRLEKEYLELFTGKTLREIRKFSYQIVPDKKMTGKPNMLFHFSELTGPASGVINNSIPVTAEFIPEQKTKDVTVINKNKSGPAGPVYDKLYYRVPDVVNVKITMGQEILFNSRRLIYQFGNVIQLPENYIIGK